VNCAEVAIVTIPDGPLRMVVSGTIESMLQERDSGDGS
jgi:hypothetical protein